MLIESCAVPPFEKNGYVVASSATGDAIVIDPGDEVEQLIAIVRRMGVTVRYIMLTHSHLDHISGCNEAKAEWDVPLVLHKDDLFLYERAVQQGIAFGIRMRPQPPIDAWFDRQSQWAFGDCAVTVHHTPGHSPGQVCLQIGEGGHRRRPPVRGRHAVCRVDRPHRSSGRRSRDAPALGARRPPPAGRPLHGLPGARPDDDHRRGTAEEPIPRQHPLTNAERRTSNAEHRARAA